MANTELVRHSRFIGVVLGISVLISAASYAVSLPGQIWDGGKQLHPENFATYAHGWPLAYWHVTCSGPDLTCNNYFEWMGFIFNTGFIAVGVFLAWVIYHRVHHTRTKRRKGKRK